MGKPGAKIAGGIDGVAGGASERQADAPYETPNQIGTKAARAGAPTAEAVFEEIAAPTNTSTKVAIISLKRFAGGLRMAGLVQKQASFESLSGVLIQ